MSKIAICIGINNVDGYTQLEGATRGAVRFSQWAQKHGYETKLFTDDNGQVIRAHEIDDFIEECIDQMAYEQILVYFSGHGVSMGPGQEFWLLSKADTKPNEFIDVTKSMDYASMCQIKYVLFISDACRTAPKVPVNVPNGSTIFPNKGTFQDNTVDIFYATRPGASAFELSENDAMEAHGIFTEALIDYLEGEYLDTVVNNQKVSDGHKTNILSQYYDSVSLKANFNYKNLPDIDQRWIISAPEVRIKIRTMVEERSFRINKVQIPDIRISHHITEFPLATFTDVEGKKMVMDNDSYKGDGRSPDPVSPIPSDPLAELQRFSDDLLKNRVEFSILKDQQKALYDQQLLVSRHIPSNRNHLHNTGIIVVGEKIIEFITPGYHYLVNDNTRVLYFGDDDFAAYGLLTISEGRSIPIAIIKGFVAELVFKDGNLFTINYTPSKNNNFAFEDYQRKKAMIEQKRSFIANAANNGFRYNEVFNSINFEDIGWSSNDPGSYLRVGKSLDPSLGLYAAYAFRESGDFSKIRSIYKYMIEDNPVIIYDVAMLAGYLEEEPPTASFCPLMTIGWSYSHLFRNNIEPIYLKAAEFLLPGLWTTFNSEGTHILQKYLKTK
ncbi:caspase family protein [Chryseobacterium arthrosphaerae]|uniref:caspase family protein n=1 Tax=Chryseobacterium arthrosphaerae TaxID=651561 RepID=UPI000F4F2316|nr:caspase family protein [Chryseobacterium arthrosphaerae]AYZ10999.1 caspase family protein [Chryseobacterium arthrosphaerae]